MTDVRVRIDGDLDAYLRNMGIEIDKQTVQALVRAAQHTEDELRRAISALFEDDSGKLAGSIVTRLVATEGGVKSSEVMLEAVHARIQDEGGTIRAKSTRNLAIPISGKAKRRKARDWPDLKLVKSRRGAKLLVERKANGFEPHYVLRPAVRIRGKGYVQRARRAAEHVVLEIITEHIAAATSNVKMPRRSVG